MKKYILHLFVVLLLLGCASKKLTKQGAKYEAAGMYEAAVTSYCSALQRNPTNADARIGLMKSANRFAESIQEKVNECYQSSDDDGVVENYTILSNLVQRASSLQVDIIIDARTTGQFEEAKGRFLVNKYEEAQQLIDQENFTQAADLLEKIVAIDGNYEESANLLRMCRCEPIYRSTALLMNAKKYRTAYAQYKKILSIDPEYKDVNELQKEALEKGILTISYLTITNSNKFKNQSNGIMAQVKQNVLNANNPFLKFVDAAQTEKILNQQKEVMSQNSEFSEIVTTARANLRSTITVQYYTSKLNEVKQKGYLKEGKSDGEVVYHKVYYYERQQSTSVTTNYTFELVSIETGEVLLTKNYTMVQNDKIHYVYYNGKNDEHLFEGSWDSQSGTSDKDTRGGNLSSLAEARKTLLTYNELEEKIIPRIAKKVSGDIIKYNPEK